MSKVVSKLGVVEGGVYRHWKGKEYVVLGFCINSTNDYRNGDVFVRYRRLGGEAEFVRLEEGFVSYVEGGVRRFEYVRMASNSEVGFAVND